MYRSMGDIPMLSFLDEEGNKYCTSDSRNHTDAEPSPLVFPRWGGSSNVWRSLCIKNKVAGIWVFCVVCVDFGCAGKFRVENFDRTNQI